MSFNRYDSLWQHNLSNTFNKSIKQTNIPIIATYTISFIKIDDSIYDSYALLDTYDSKNNYDTTLPDILTIIRFKITFLNA